MFLLLAQEAASGTSPIVWLGLLSGGGALAAVATWVLNIARNTASFRTWAFGAMGNNGINGRVRSLEKRIQELEIELAHRSRGG